MYTCSIQSFKILASFWRWAGLNRTWWKILEDTFSCDVHIVFAFVSSLMLLSTIGHIWFLKSTKRKPWSWWKGPRQANLVLIAYASSEGSGEPAHPRSLARTSAARLYKQWIKRNFQTESQIPGPSEWLGMRSWNLSWRNAGRHKFA